MERKRHGSGLLGSERRDGGIAEPAIAPRPEGDRETRRLTLTVPAKPEAVRVVRAVMRSWAAGAGFVLDELEELCLAMDETFAGLISAVPAPRTVTVRIRSEGNGVDVVAVRDAEAELWPPVSAQTALARRVLSTLIDEVRFVQTDEGPAIHLVKRRSDPGEPSA